MPATLAPPAGTCDQELLTFRTGPLLLGLDLHCVKEINCDLRVTRAPHADDYVLGVMNLRSDVITVLDFGRLLALPSAGPPQHGVIVSTRGELVALAVDHVADVVTVPRGALDPLPPNFRRHDERIFSGVYVAAGELVLVLDLAEALRGRKAS